MITDRVEWDVASTGTCPWPVGKTPGLVSNSGPGLYREQNDVL